jgi:hypothetical protein
LKYLIKNLLGATTTLYLFFFLIEKPLLYIAKIKIFVNSSKLTRLNLSLNNFITHLVANINFLFKEIGKGTPSTLPPIFNGNNKTVGEIFIIEKKNKRLGSTPSFIFKLYFNFKNKLKAHNFLPLKIKEPKNIL